MSLFCYQSNLLFNVKNCYEWENVTEFRKTCFSRKKKKCIQQGQDGSGVFLALLDCKPRTKTRIVSNVGFQFCRLAVALMWLYLFSLVKMIHIHQFTQQGAPEPNHQISLTARTQLFWRVWYNWDEFVNICIWAKTGSHTHWVTNITLYNKLLWVCVEIMSVCKERIWVKWVRKVWSRELQVSLTEVSERLKLIYWFSSWRPRLVLISLIAASQRETLSLISSPRRSLSAGRSDNKNRLILTDDGETVPSTWLWND